MVKKGTVKKPVETKQEQPQQQEQSQQQQLGFSVEEVQAIEFMVKKCDPCNMINESPSIKAKCEAIMNMVKESMTKEAIEKELVKA